MSLVMKAGKVDISGVRVRRFIDAIVEAAIFDAEQGIGEYDPRNSGQQLLTRLNLSTYRSKPRNGDGKYARSLYTAARWLYQTEKDD